MSTVAHDIATKLRNLCNVLEDDGVTDHQDVTEPIYLLFFKMNKETDTDDQPPDPYRWEDLEAKPAPAMSRRGGPCRFGDNRQLCRKRSWGW